MARIAHVIRMMARWGRVRPPIPLGSDGSIRGVVEGVSRGCLHGWALDPDAPQIRLEMRIEPDEGLPIRGVADIYRGDLHRLGIGDGHCGFSVPAGDAGEGRRFRVSEARSGRPLSPNPFVVRSPDLPRTGCVGTLAFGLDPVPLGGTRVSGWAQDTSDPRRPLRIGLRTGRAAVAAGGMRATLYRPDRVDIDPHPFSGFVLPRPGPGGGEALIEMTTGTELARLT